MEQKKTKKKLLDPNVRKGDFVVFLIGIILGVVTLGENIESGAVILIVIGSMAVNRLFINK